MHHLSKGLGFCVRTGIIGFEFCCEVKSSLWFDHLHVLTINRTGFLKSHCLFRSFVFKISLKRDPMCAWVVRIAEACKLLMSWVLRSLSRFTFLCKWLMTCVLSCPDVSNSEMPLTFYVSLKLFLNWPRKVAYHLKAGLTSCHMFEVSSSVSFLGCHTNITECLNIHLSNDRMRNLR